MATLGDIRAEVRQRADIQRETARYPDAELDAYINKSILELFGLLVRHSLIQDEATQEIVADGSATYALAATHYATIGFFYDDGNDPIPLTRSSSRARPHGAATVPSTGVATTYRTAKLLGVKTVELYPRPGSGTYLHSYIPVPAALVDDVDELDSVLGWDEYVVIDAAIKCLRKEGTSTTPLQKDKAEIRARIVDEAESQEINDAATVQDVNQRRRPHGSDDSEWATRWWATR